MPDGLDGTQLVTHAADNYGVAFGVGLGAAEGKVFRIGHLGMLTDVMVCAGLSAAEMAMRDMNLPIKAGSGVAAAQECFRDSPPHRCAPREGCGMTEMMEKNSFQELVIPTYEDVLAAP